jgi:hypothetical protein
MATPEQPNLVKLDICLYKKDDVDYDDFIKWLTETYPPRAIPLMKKYGLVQWSAVSSHFPLHEGFLPEACALQTVPAPYVTLLAASY